MGPAGGEVLHFEQQQPALGRVAEGQLVALAGDGHVPRLRALGQFPPAHGEGAHGRERLLPVVLKVQEGYAVHAHVAVVGNRERQGIAAVVHKVVVPFLYPVGRGLDVRAAVDGQEPFGVARLGYVPAAVQQGARADYFMLSHIPRSFLSRRMSRRKRAGAGILPQAGT